MGKPPPHPSMIHLASALAVLAPAVQPVSGDAIPDLVATLALQSGQMVPLPTEQGSDRSELLSYSYMEFGTVWRDIDEYDNGVRIWDLRGSVDLLDVLYVQGSYAKESTSAGHSDARILGLGLGAHLPLGRALDIHGDATWLSSKVSSDLSDLDGKAYGFELYGGGRWIPWEWYQGGLELHGGMRYVDLDNRIAVDPIAYGWEVGARVHYLELVSFDTTFGRLGDDEVLSLSVRLSL